MSELRQDHLARWVGSQDQGLGPDMLLSQDMRGGVCRIQLRLDSQRPSLPFIATPKLTVLREERGAKPTAEQWPLTWTAADVLTAEVPVSFHSDVQRGRQPAPPLQKIMSGHKSQPKASVSRCPVPPPGLPKLPNPHPHPLPSRRPNRRRKRYWTR